MFWSCDPANIVLLIEVQSCLSKFRSDELETVVVDENVGGTTLHLVCADSRLDTADGRHDDTFETFLVHRHLNSDVWKVIAAVEAFWSSTSIEARVLVDLSDRAE